MPTPPSLHASFAFGDSPELADRLLAYVLGGTKRATVGTPDEAGPEAGQVWGVLDGAGELRCAIRTVETRLGRLDTVDVAFAWDEGEGDRTIEDWLEGHRRYYRRNGVDDPDALVVVFERFEVVWPVADRAEALVPGVREAGFDEPGPRPAVVDDRGGRLVFRPRADHLEVVSVTGDEGPLRAALAVLDRRRERLR
jgi:uncharacterized protein YhfF